MSSPTQAELDREAMMIVDDQAAFRRVARPLIGATPGFQAISDADSGAEAPRRPTTG